MIMLVSHELPSGSVTLLFTDIEGSTRLLNERKVACPRHLIWRSRVRQRQTREMVSYRARRLTAEEARSPIARAGKRKHAARVQGAAHLGVRTERAQRPARFVRGGEFQMVCARWRS